MTRDFVTREGGHQITQEPRGWVVRLGSYLRIFGKPAPGTMGWKTAPEYIDGLIRTAQEREEEFKRGN